jgi:hypothetical protein
MGHIGYLLRKSGKYMSEALKTIIKFRRKKMSDIVAIRTFTPNSELSSRAPGW